MFNEEVRKKFNTAIVKREDAAKKDGIKILSAYVSTIVHTIFYIIEASSQQSVENYFVDVSYVLNDIFISKM